MRRIAVICARGGSQGLAGKNLRVLQGRSLVQRAVDDARRVEIFDVIAVSSDSDEILDVAAACEVETVRRPAELASASAAKLPAIRHCVDVMEQRTGTRFDVVVDLDATSPLRLPEDVQGAVELLESTDAGNVVSAAPARRSPEFNLVELSEAGTAALVRPPATPVTRRQDGRRFFDLNAAVYAWRRDALDACGDRVITEATRVYEMPPERSVDIDDDVDLALVELLLARRGP